MTNEAPAPWDTLLGQLQRGRGAGLLRVVRNPDAAAHAAVAALLRSPTWQSMGTGSARHVAEAAQAVGLPVRAREHAEDMALDDPPPQTPQDRNQPRDPFPRADTALSTEALLARAEPRNWRKTAKVLAGRSGDADILRDAVQDAAPWARLAALDALRTLRTPTAAADAAQVAEQTEDSQLRQAATRYIGSLPSEDLLPHARRWLDAGGPLAPSAAEMLATHAEPCDATRLMVRLATTPESLHAGSLASGLARIRETRATWLLRWHYERAWCADCRAEVAAALHVLDPAFADAYGTELLFDSDQRAVAVGIRCAARDRPIVRERLAHLAEAPSLDEDTRAPARAALLPPWCS